MSRLRQSLADYLTLRRALGYRLERPEKLLGQFISYLEGVGAETVTIERALAWACLPSDGNANWWAHRLSVVRVFAAYLHTVDPAAEVPPPDLLPWRPCRAQPYIYSDDEVTALMAAAAMFPSPLRVATYQTLIGLLACTGIRVGEAIRLDRDDFDPGGGLLTVRFGKFGKTRELPLHRTAVAAIDRYRRQRDRHQPPATSPALFISPAGTRLLYCNVHATFRQLRTRAELAPGSGPCRPRIHDLRHSFAVRTLLEAYRDGHDVQHRLALLSTYLGHVNPGATYWYLSAVPELMSLAAQRLEQQQSRP
ncbi:MAG: tyrosine-type recombinase/integrase [Actinomycetota bacterium]